MRVVLTTFLACGVLNAHQIEEIPITLEVHGDRITATIEADAAYMLPEYRGDDQEAKDLAWLRELGPGGWLRIEQETDRYLHDCLRFEADGKSVPWKLTVPDLRERSPDFLTRGEPEELPILLANLEASLPPGSTKLEAIWKEPYGVVLIVTIGSGASAETIPLVSGERAVIAERTGKQLDLRPADPSATYWLHLGFVHILPFGVDHILFVLGLFLLAPKWKPLLQQTIIFTLAHSLSLAAAALGWVTFPANPVEILIAASIAWVGIENLRLNELAKSRLLVVASFGLIHGLGFAGVLAELLPADQPEKVPAALLAFNLGVELGQIAVLFLAFACFGWLGKNLRHVKIYGSLLVAAAGLILLVERIVGIEILPFL